MELNTLRETVNTNGEYSCGDIGVSASEWLELLKQPEARKYHEALFCFLREPNQKGSCTSVAQKYGKSLNYYNGNVKGFSQWVQKRLNRFRVIGIKGSETFWPIAMEKGWQTKKEFLWLLRTELTEALRDLLMEHLIEELRKHKPFNGYEESYKWQLLDNTEGKDALGIIRALKGKNIVANAYVDPVFNKLNKEKPSELIVCGEHLLDETIPIDKRLARFKQEMQDLGHEDWKNFANDERTASAILTCAYPEKYTFYKWEVYKRLCEYFGYDINKKGTNFGNFMEIINNLVAKYGETVQQIMLSEIDRYKNKPLNLAIQTLFWCLKDFMLKEMDAAKQHTSQTSANEGTDYSRFDKGVITWKRHKNIVLYGAPGTGKTHSIPEYVVRLCCPTFNANHAERSQIVAIYNQLKEEGRIAFTTFHQSMDYEDWVEGLRPVVTDNNQVGYNIESGIFKRLCEKANDTNTQEEMIQNDFPQNSSTLPDGENSSKPYIMVIDEINRGNVSKIFGELLTLLEADKRKGNPNAEKVVLPYSKEAFEVPANVFVIATMNTADRSLGALDYAIRRRFAFIAERPYALDNEGFDRDLFKQVSQLFINNFDEYEKSNFDSTFKLQAADTLSADYKPEEVWIGHCYFLMHDENGEDFTNDRILYEIIPLLEEYIRDGILTTDAQTTIDELYDRAIK